MNGSLRALGCVLTVAAGVLLAPVGPNRALAQTPDTLAEVQDASLGALRTHIESRYQVRSLRDGILLLPSYGNPGVQTIELSDGEIAIDGRSVTGAELRERVPEDAEAILRLSYLAPDDRRIPGALGPLAIFLDSGAVLYSRPAVGPLSDPGYILPGSVRAETPDLEAIRENLQPGMAVYFH